MKKHEIIDAWLARVEAMPRERRPRVEGTVIGDWVVAVEGVPYWGQIVATHGTRKVKVRFYDIEHRGQVKRQWNLSPDAVWEKYDIFDSREEAEAAVDARLETTAAGTKV